jgi:proteasome assembly chaperone (PAC2) family protein
MTNEEWDRKTEFLLNQQAKFEVDMQELKESQKKTEKYLAQLAEMISSCASLMFEGFKITDAKIRELAETTNREILNLNAKLDRHIDEGHPGAAT